MPPERGVAAMPPERGGAAMPAAIRHLRGFADLLSRLGLAVAGLLLVFVTGYMLVECVLRAGFDTSTFVAPEVIGYAMAPMTTLAMAATLRRGMLIRIDLISARLGEGARRALELVFVLATIGLTLWIADLFWGELLHNWRRGSVSETIARIPLWVPPALVLSGLPIFLLQLATYALELLAGGRPIEDASDTSAT